MGGKPPLTFEFIREAFSAAGFILLSTDYKNKYQLLDYSCPEGHVHRISWGGFRNGNRCPYCTNKAKKTYEEIKNAFEKESYILRSINYVNAHGKLDYICPNGHIGSISWGNFQQGRRCRVCAGNILLEYPEVKNIFEQAGYTLLSEIYVNNASKLEYKCPLGHIHSILLGSFISGTRCPTCAYIKQCGENHWNWKGGYSYRDYCPIWSDKGYKEDIKKRDNYICQNPYCFKTDTLLHVHHIDYNKKNCHQNNLISVCRTCNVRANYDRLWHTEWYQAIMNKKFCYTY